MTTERDMLDRLNTRYGKFSGNGIRYTRAEHVKITTGFDSRRIADYIAVDLYNEPRGGGPTVHGHEVKVSRSDWLTELRDPTKAEQFAQYCDYWWLVVADKDIVKTGELPPKWGLMVASGSTVRVLTQAPKNLDVQPMPRSLQATLTRAVMKTTLRLAAKHDPAVQFVKNNLNL
jgi:hypothetical protein